MTGHRVPGDPELLLRAAASDVAWPATPDLTSAVLARITTPVAPDLRPAVVARISGGRRQPFRLLRPVLLAAVLVVAVAGLAAGLGFRLPGLELQRVDRTPPAGAGLDLGSPIPLADVVAAGTPEVRLPAGLPQPDVAYLLGAGKGRIVTVAWRAGVGEDTLEGTDLALTLLAVAGSPEEALLAKAAGPGTTIEAVDVEGDRGWWIAGAPHELLVRGPDSSIEVVRSAIAGDTLLFAREGTLYRLESSLGRDATLEIARSMP